ncbi:MAG: SCO family protein [Phycisphaerales bacterium]
MSRRWTKAPLLTLALLTGAVMFACEEDAASPPEAPSEITSATTAPPTPATPDPVSERDHGTIGSAEGATISAETVARVGSIQTSIDPDVLETLIGTRPNLDLEFTNQDGEPVRLGDFEGETLVITTIYTSCPIPDMCPRLTADMAWLARQVPSELEDDIHFLLISFDPQRDTPAALKAYGESRGIVFEHTDLLRADIDTTRTLIRDELQIPLSIDPMTNQIVTHAMMIHVINPDGFIVVERTAKSTEAVELVAREMVRAATLPFTPPAESSGASDG